MSGVPSDLARDLLQERMPDRALRTYPAILSTEADALAWARQGAPDGAVVVAGYQASPRGRSGLAWGGEFTPGHGLGFSLVVRPDLSVEREGWLYTVALLGAAHALADETARIEWPDRLVRGDETVAAVGVQVEPGARDLDWGVASVLIPGAEPPRTGVLVDVVEAIEHWLRAPVEETLAAYRQHCATLGRRVRARLLPLGAAAPTVLGAAADVSADGGLVIHEDERDTGVVVLPQALGFLEDPSEPREPPDLHG